MTKPDDRQGGLIVISGAGGALGTRLTTHFSSRAQPVLALDRHFDTGIEESENLRRRCLDLTSNSHVRDALEAAFAEHGQIKLLVNAVGMIWNAPMLKLEHGQLNPHDLEDWRKVIEANLTAPFVVASEAALLMVRSGGGAIVNFSSIAAQGNAGQVAYSAAKAGLEGMTRTMSRELGPMGVRVNAISLGFIDVPSTRANVPRDQLDRHAGRTPIGGLGIAEDVIGAVEFLAENAFVNGAILSVDGGLRL